MTRPPRTPGSGSSPGRAPLPAQPRMARQGPSTAQAILAGLALPQLPPPGAPCAPPLPSLARLPRDASMVYDIGSVDASGRVASQPVIAAVGWQPGDRLEILPIADAIVIRPSPDGLWSVPRRGGICLPAGTRHRHRIAQGDRILLAAAHEHSLVIVYPASAIDEMITGYHAARPEASGHE